MRTKRSCPFIDKDEVKEEIKQKDTSKYMIFKKDDESSNLVSGSFEFKCCPASYSKTDKSLINLIALVNWSEDMKTPLVSGGLLNHTNWFFEARNVIINEQRTIEKEELQKQKTNIKSSTGSKAKSRKHRPSR